MTIKRETITVDAHVGYCDGCGARGPHSEMERSDVAEGMDMSGWSHDPDAEKDYCKKCTAQRDPDHEGAQ